MSVRVRARESGVDEERWRTGGSRERKLGRRGGDNRCVLNESCTWERPPVAMATLPSTRLHLSHTHQNGLLAGSYYCVFCAEIIYFNFDRRF